MIAAVLPVLFCMGNSCACGPDGCTIGTGSDPATPAPVLTVSKAVEDPDPVQSKNGPPLYTVSCSQAPSVYPLPASWTVTFSDGSIQDRSILWPKGSPNQVQFINYWIDNDPNYNGGGAVEPGYVQAVQDAIDAWNNALANNAPGTLLVNVQSVNSETNSQIQIAETNYPDSVNEPGSEAFADITLGRPLNQTFLQQATIDFDGPQLNQDPNEVYGALVHELGHSLGLTHNQYSSSVMFPNIPACLTKDAQTIPSWDTKWLESTYDPYFANHPIGPGCRYRCPLATRRPAFVANNGKPRQLVGSVAPILRATNSMHWRLTQGYQGRGDAFGTAMRIRRDSRNGNVSVSLDDHSGSGSASLQSMYLMSSLVARVTIEPGTRYVNGFPYRLAVRRARLLQIYRHLMGPDAAYRVGDTVNILDKQPSITGVFADDPPLDEGSDVIVFLRTTHGRGPLAGMPGLHVPTMPHVSKIGIGPGGAMYVAGSTGSEMAAQINARRMTTLRQILVPGSPEMSPSVPIWPNESVLIQQLLRARGVTSPLGIQRYEDAMVHDPGKVVRWAIAHDGNPNGTRL